jgi:hypothetical protein
MENAISTGLGEWGWGLRSEGVEDLASKVSEMMD